jgi:polyether ionophore transport system permease protein
MAATATGPATPTTAPSATIRRRLSGPRSVYAKGVRDALRAFLIVTVLLAGLMLAVGAGIPHAYPTQDARDDMVRIATGLGQGLTSKPVNADTVGGWVQWKYGADFLWIAALWSILALSSTLTAEARRGSLDVVAVAPLTRRRIALEKVAAHLTMMALACTSVGVAAWLAGAVFGTLPGDAIPPASAAGLALWMGLGALAFGALPFALAPFLGRGAAVGIASFNLFAGWVLSGVQVSAPAVRGLAALTPWAWTADHLPLARQYDWLSLLPVAFVAVALLWIGVETFARRDLGASSSLNLPGLPDVMLGLRGPFGRAFAERLPTAAAWAAVLGIVGAVSAAASSGIAAQMANVSPETAQLFRSVLPVDVTTPAGLLEFGIIQVGFLITGFAAATLVSGWAADETSGRLEVLLATPLTRARWAAAGGLGVYAAIGLITVALGLGVGAGAALAGIDAVTSMIATAALGVFAAGMAGIGLAVGGLFGTSVAAAIVTAIVGATLAIEWLAPALHLPGWVHQLALTAHLGQPMLGAWDWAGMAACLALAVGGLGLSAWGISRRDIGA